MSKVVAIMSMSLGTACVASAWVGLVALSSLFACSNSGSDQRAGTVGAAWKADTTPIISIGSQPGDSVSFNAISAIALLEDGSVAVADASNTLRIFDRNGRLSRSYGQEGEGPGDFRRIASITERGSDTLMVYDQDLQRISYIARRDGLFSTAAVPVGFPLQLVGYGAGRTMVFGPMARQWKETSPNTEVGLLHFLVTTIDGATPRSLGEMEGPSHFVVTFPDGGRGQVSIPFSPAISAAVRDTVLYVSRGDNDSIFRHGLNGAAMPPLVLADEIRPVTAADWDAYVESSLASARDEEQRRVRRKQFSAMRRPARHPTILKQLIGRDGELWIQRGSTQGQPTRWQVLDKQDSLTAAAYLPRGVDIMAIGADRIAGIATDADGVQSVHVFRRK